MTQRTKLAWLALQTTMQKLALVTFSGLALVMIVATSGAILGLLPWVELYVDWKGSAVPHAGIYAQGGLTLLSVSLVFFLPTALRVMVLENSHRRFAMNMHDIARAYGAVHHADRTGVFRIASEFDSVRERMKYLSDHPELNSLEPDLLEVAAQMSHVSRELAHVYSDERVSRARDILFQRHREVEHFNARLVKARAVSDALKTWRDEVEREEARAAGDFEVLKRELQDVLPELGFGDLQTHSSNIVELPPKVAE